MFHRYTRQLGSDHEVTVIAHDMRGTTLVTVEHDYGVAGSTMHEHELDVGLSVEEAEEWLRGLPEYEEVEDPGQQAMDALAEVLPLLTDEQAELVPQAFPEWAAGTAYAVGQRVRYDGKLYRCVQAHTSQEGWEPATAAALWVRTAPDGEIPDWVQPTGAHDAYGMGDKVRHVGKVWESMVDGNVWEPGVYGWSEVTS